MKYLSRFLSSMRKTPEEIVLIGAETRQLLENKHFQAAIDRVREDIIRVGHGCDPDDLAKTQRVIISMQLLESIVRELERQIEAGDFTRQQLEQERKAKDREFRR